MDAQTLLFPSYRLWEVMETVALCYRSGSLLNLYFCF